MIRFDATRPRLRFLLFTAVVLLTTGAGLFWEKFAFGPTETGSTSRVLLSGTSAWEARLSGLAPGSYFVSAGRPKGRCSILLDGAVLSSTGQNPLGLRDSLGLGASFTVQPGTVSQLSITCLPQRGFASGLSDEPRILPERQGRVVQAIREILGIWLPIVFPAFLLVVVWSLSPPALRTEGNIPAPLWSEMRWYQRLGNPFVCFALAATAYGISLSFGMWLWLSPEYATLFHIIVRITISYAYIRLVLTLVSAPMAPVSITRIGYSLLMMIPLGVAMLSGADSPMLLTAYKTLHPLFGITTLAAFILACRSNSGFRTHGWLAFVTLTWALTQIADSVLNYLRSGLYTAPFALATVSYLVAVLRRREVEFAQRTDRCARTALVLQDQNPKIDDALRETAKLSFAETNWSRLSVYIDAFCLGRSTRPHEKMIRLFETGYEKDTSTDYELSFGDNQGRQMKRALDSGDMVIDRKGSLGDYCIVPIGRLACVNFSSRKSLGDSAFDESIEFIQHLNPAIQTLRDRLLNTNLLKHLLLQRVKATRGVGEFAVRYGAIRLDVQKYTKIADDLKRMHGGADLFSPFVMNQYIPALVKHLPFAEVELDEGDMVYLVILEEFVPEGMTIEMACFEVMKQVMEFCDGPGAAICQENGFPIVRMTGGITCGTGTLICHEWKVKTSGHPANLAARMAGAKFDEAILVNEAIAEIARSNQFKVAEPREFLGKTDRFTVYPVYYRNFQRKVA